MGSVMADSVILNNVDLEPEIATLLAGSLRLRHKPSYKIKTLQEVETLLLAFMENEALLKSPSVKNLKRLGGGASKEQFVFDLCATNFSPQRCVLRMDPLEGAIVTSRKREVAALEIMTSVVPVPKPLWSDFVGDKLGQPAMITNFVPGVTKPTNSDSNVSGFGTAFDKTTREHLSETFMRYLVAIHSVDWRTINHDCFQAPVADPQQAARWQVNWWTTVWHNDKSQGLPLMALAEQWMRDNLPDTSGENLVFVHSDYRTGNYLYDEQSLEITSILDWELVHIGDFHEDLAWAAIETWSTVENGMLMVSGLIPIDEFCQLYTETTGRKINRKTLHFYQVLGLYKSVAVCLATSINAARRSHNHQDILLSWLATAGYKFLSDMRILLEQERNK